MNPNTTYPILYFQECTSELDIFAAASDQEFHNLLAYLNSYFKVKVIKMCLKSMQNYGYDIPTTGNKRAHNFETTESSLIKHVYEQHYLKQLCLEGGKAVFK